MDIVIVGAGIAGSALACALANTNYRVAVIEAAKIPEQLPPLENSISGYDLRVSALTHESQAILEKLGAWEIITSYRASAYRDMVVWDAEGTGSIEFSAADIHQRALGHIVENRVICASLMQRLRESNNITVMSETSVEKISIHSRQQDAHHQVKGATETVIELSNGKTLRCKLLVGADGANSRVRASLQIPVREWSYDQKAIVATVQTAQPNQHTAWQRFLPTGPLAFLPLSSADSGKPEFNSDRQDCLSSIVWSADSEFAEQLMDLDDEAFIKQLGTSFEHRLGHVVAVSKRAAFPLRQCHAAEYFKPGAVLVADAAHSIHPLAGQGINLGLADVAALAEELQRAQDKGLSPGDELVLRRYQRNRKADNLLMMGVMEGFKRLFGNKSLPVRWLRNTGLNVVNELGPLKRRIIKQAMGMH